MDRPRIGPEAVVVVLLAVAVASAAVAGAGADGPAPIVLAVAVGAVVVALPTLLALLVAGWTTALLTGAVLADPDAGPDRLPAAAVILAAAVLVTYMCAAIPTEGEQPGTVISDAAASDTRCNGPTHAIRRTPAGRSVCSAARRPDGTVRVVTGDLCVVESAGRGVVRTGAGSAAPLDEAVVAAGSSRVGRGWAALTGVEVGPEGSVELAWSGGPVPMRVNSTDVQALEPLPPVPVWTTTPVVRRSALAPGERILLLSDAVVTVRGVQGSTFDAADHHRALRDLPLHAAADEVWKRLRRHCGGTMPWGAVVVLLERAGAGDPGRQGAQPGTVLGAGRDRGSP